MTEEILTAKVEITQAVANIRKLADEIAKFRQAADEVGVEIDHRRQKHHHLDYKALINYGRHL